jgi:hypothetical protein
MPDDDELEQELRQAERLLDPVPARLLRGAVDIFSWRTIDAELAALTFDSADASSAAAVRGSGGAGTVESVGTAGAAGSGVAGLPRLLTFDAGEVSIELELAGSAAERAITGQLVPAQPAEVELRLGDQRLTTTADALGRFEVIARGSGPISLRFRLADSEIVTEWVSPLPAQPGAGEGDRLAAPGPGGDLAVGAVLALGQQPLRLGLPVAPGEALGDVPVVRDPADRQHGDHGDHGGDRPG